MESVKEGRRSSFYLSCKVVKALPEKNLNGYDGYRIFYPDGYVSWCPKNTFESSYRNIDEFANDTKEKGKSEVLAQCLLKCDPLGKGHLKVFLLNFDF